MDIKKFTYASIFGLLYGYVLVKRGIRLTLLDGDTGAKSNGNFIGYN